MLAALAVTGVAGAAPANAIPAEPSGSHPATPVTVAGKATQPASGERRMNTGAERRTNDWAEEKLRGMTLEQKVGQLFVTWVNGQRADEAHPKNKEDFGVDTPAQVVRKYHLGGVIYFNNESRDNIDSPKQIAELSNGLQKAATGAGARVPLTVATDQEGGTITRIEAPATELPGAMALGAGRGAAQANQSARISGHELRAMGINQNFAPDADVNSNPLNPIIGVRSFSSDPQLAGQMVDAQVRGYQDSAEPTETTSAAAKHFPGHGDADTDSHTGLPQIDRTAEQWRQLDKPPFQAAVDAGVENIMSAHIKFPKLDPSGEPATLSRPILTGLLREELGYNGVVSTDSLSMEGVREMHPDAEIPVLALKAGVDQLVMPVNLDVAKNSVLKAVRSGELTEQRIDKSVLRLLKLKAKRGVVAKPFADVDAVDEKVGNEQNLADAQRIADRTTTVLRNDENALPLEEKPGSVLVTGWEDTSRGVPVPENLAKHIGDRVPNTKALTTGAEPSDERINQAVSAAKGVDTVVAVVGQSADDPAQHKLIDRLQATGKRVITVVAEVPYDAGYLNSAKTMLASYGYNAPTLEAATKVIFGEASPQGKLPVEVPDGNNPDQVRFPFGHGLSW
ncbi:MAG: glycoside hydrolase family 3 protein [Pseudonocardiaceae bacterium]|nr:glycoside hydrolase family 3 protein [Pseudonocardiaceae bacterium]